jgi:hypothetical protein
VITLTLTSNGSELTTVTNADGAYAFEDVQGNVHYNIESDETCNGGVAKELDDVTCVDYTVSSIDCDPPTQSNTSSGGGSSKPSELETEPAPASDEVATFSINGSVALGGNTPAGVTITIVGSGVSITTAEDGNFVISGLLPGTYNLAAEKDGYTIGEQSITISDADITLELSGSPTSSISLLQNGLKRGGIFGRLAIVTINGTNTRFNSSSAVAFESDAIKLIKQKTIGKDSIRCLVFVKPARKVQAGTAIVTVTTGSEKVQTTLGIE